MALFKTIAPHVPLMLRSISSLSSTTKAAAFRASIPLATADLLTLPAGSSSHMRSRSCGHRRCKPSLVWPPPLRPQAHGIPSLPPPPPADQTDDDVGDAEVRRRPLQPLLAAAGGLGLCAGLGCCCFEAAVRLLRVPPSEAPSWARWC